MALWIGHGSALIAIINEKLYLKAEKEANIFTLGNLPCSLGPHQEFPTLLGKAPAKPGTFSKYGRELES